MFDGFDFLGFGIKGYRSFSRDSGLVGPFGKVHLLTGQNNSGKSALADVAYRVLPCMRGKGTMAESEYPFTEGDRPIGMAKADDGPYVLTLCFRKDALLRNAVYDESRHWGVREQIDELLSIPCISRGSSNQCWFDFEIPRQKWGQHTQAKFDIVNENLRDEIAGANLQQLALALSGSSNSATDFQDICRKLIPWGAIPQAIKIEAIRSATSSKDADNSEIAGGDGLINKLLKLSNPTPDRQYASGARWNMFEAFVQDILGDNRAEVRIDADATMIQVKTGGTAFFSLADLGTGIEELVILAAVVTCNDRKLIIIEEPEIHLHPTLQAKIVQLLKQDENDNRFLITTHSPTLMNSGDVTITQVTKRQSISHTRQIDSAIDIRDALDDLGAHPSDLLQSNYVIWVEGPSDRVYVNHWLGKLAPELVEGIHYSIMIYGGRLLNACSADWQETADGYIKLFRINSHFCVLMDSDRPAKGRKINKTKLRIRDECEKSGCLAWITDFRVIENYVPSNLLAEAIEACHPGKRFRHKLDDPYTGPLDFTFTKTSVKPDKIAIARYIATKDYELTAELTRRVEALIAEINAANSNR